VPPGPLHRAFKRWLSGLAGLATTLQVSIASILLGLQPVPHDVPLVGLVRAHPVISLATSLALLVIVAAGLVLAYRPAPAPSGFPYLQLLAATTTLATCSTTAIVVLIAMVLSRPSWCPGALCAPSNVPAGTYDANLAVSFTTLQSSAFLIDGDPASYSLAHLPASTGPAAVPAVQIGAGGRPCRLQLSIRDLGRGGPGLFVEDVLVAIDLARSPPSPTRVWLQPVGDEELHANPYTARYEGQQAGQAVTATYDGAVPQAHVRLRPQEQDSIVLTMTATRNAYVRFHIQIRYRVMNETGVRTLTLRDSFIAVFADEHTWVPYQLSNGALLPA
jgi:hypothetical protein